MTYNDHQCSKLSHVTSPYDQKAADVAGSEDFEDKDSRIPTQRPKM